PHGPRRGRHRRPAGRGPGGVPRGGGLQDVRGVHARRRRQRGVGRRRRAAGPAVRARAAATRARRAGRTRRVPGAEDRQGRALARAAQGRHGRPARGGRRRAREVRARARRGGGARAARARGAVPREARGVVRLPAVLSRLGHLPREGRAEEEAPAMILPPTDSQWAAARAVDEHVLVTAGAGAGKTQTVVYRILYLLGVELRGERIARPHRLHDVAAITFTNQAAADLKQKVRSALRDAGLRRAAYEVDVARISTVHACCGELLRAFARRAGRAPARELLEEGAGIALAAEAVRETLLDAIEQQSVPGLDELLAVWSVGDVEQWLLQLVGEADRLHAIRAREDLTDAERTVAHLALHALARVEERLEARGAVDFDRMIVWTRDLLRDDPGIRRALQRRIRTLIVDEFQDVDPVQKEIAFLLAEPASGSSETTRLMLVGDPKQSIYRFRRADVTVWRSVEREFTERGTGRVLALDESFRSVAPVLGFVDATIGQLLDSPLNGEAHQDFEVPYQAVRSRRSDGPEDL